MGDDFDPESDMTVAAVGPQGPLKRDLVAGLEKGLAVIEAFDQERPRLTISEVAERTGLTRAAARRYLLTLTHLGLVHQERKMFALAPRVLRLAQSDMHSARLPRVLQPALLELAHTLKEASAASVLDGADAVCIAATSAGRNVRHSRDCVNCCRSRPSPQLPGCRGRQVAGILGAYPT